MKNFIKSLSTYLSVGFIDNAKKMSKFLLVYTLCYAIIVISIKYAIPFVIAYIFALSLRPIKNKILSINKYFKKNKISNGVASGILTFGMVTVLVLIIFALGYQIVEQIRGIYEYMKNPDNFNNIISESSERIKDFLTKIDNYNPEIMVKVNEALQSIVSKITSLLTIFFQNLLNIIVTIPTAFILVLITIITTFFFTKDIEKIHGKLKSTFSEKGIKVIEKVRIKKNEIFTGYIKAFSIIMLVLCFYSIIVYKFAGVKYALALGVITAIVDALPLFGAGLFYGVLAIMSFSVGDIKSGVILLIGYIGCVIIRQYLEQILVSSFLGVHPLVIIIALFLAFTPLGFIGTFYFLGACLLYEAFYSGEKNNKKQKNE